MERKGVSVFKKEVGVFDKEVGFFDKEVGFFEKEDGDRIREYETAMREKAIKAVGEIKLHVMPEISAFDQKPKEEEFGPLSFDSTLGQPKMIIYSPKLL